MTLTVRKWSLIAERTALCPVLRVVVATVTLERRPVVMRETALAATGKILSVFARVGPAGTAVTAEGRPLITGRAALCPVLRVVIAAVTMERRPVVMGETALAASGEISPAFTRVGSASAGRAMPGLPFLRGKRFAGPAVPCSGVLSPGLAFAAVRSMPSGRREARRAG